MVEKILFITLSNIGDCVLTLPALDYLRENFPESKVTILVGERPKEIFENNPSVEEVIIYDKKARIREKIKLFLRLNREGFDIVIDLRNSFFGRFLRAKRTATGMLKFPRDMKHMKERHLRRVKGLGSRVQAERTGKSLIPGPEDEKYAQQILSENNISVDDKIIIIAPGARSHIKKWPQEKFAGLTDRLSEEFKAKIVLTGDKNDMPEARYISEHSKGGVTDLSGRTTIAQLACLLKRASCVVTNDSAILHLASYLNTPVAAIFGPTNEEEYGPWSENSLAIRKEIPCRPCEKAQCKFGTLDCLRRVKIEDVLEAVRKILTATCCLSPVNKHDFKRILIVRTDRIGDVLLSTPVITAVRKAYPFSYIAMMVSPYARDIVEGNPDIDEVIIYDKDIKQKSWLSSMKFSLRMKKKKFDLALILHPTNRAHLIVFFAGVTRRVGYDRKLGFLLTDKIKHTKQAGRKHELEYNLDFARYLGIEPQEKSLKFPIRQESERWVDDLFLREGIKPAERLVAIHPGASCPSKIWPVARFAEVAERLAENYNVRVCVIAGPKEKAVAENLIRNMPIPALNLAGRTSLTQLASLLKRCSLLISNDSGPVHIASAVGTPVISIFGRAQKGLSPKRWGPVGKGDRFLHQDVGCIKCLAHNCLKEFACLSAIKVEDVLEAAGSILRGHS